MLRTAFLCICIATGMIVSVVDSAEAQLRGPVVSGQVHLSGGSTGDLPFWLTSNRYGTVGRSGANVIGQIGAHVPFARDGGWDYAIGADFVGRRADRSALYAHELYAGVAYGPVQVTLGRQEEVIGLVDSTLSLGSTTWSRNTTPMPKAVLQTPEYVSVPGTDGFVGVRGYLAHGWFESDRFVEDAYLHQKNAYLRVLPERWPVQAHAGVQHNAMWGGTHPEHGPLPSSFGDFIRIFWAQTVDEGESDVFGEDSSLGNTVVNYDVGLTAQAFGLQGRAYRQFHFEEKGSELFRSAWDGIWGVAIRSEDRNQLVSGILYEHLYTMRQNAKSYEEEGRSERIWTWGRSDIHNHFVYGGGWTYEGRTIGIPLLMTDTDAPNIAADISGRPIANNKVIAHHIGIEGVLPFDLRYRLLWTHSRNFGTVRNELDDLTQVSAQAEVERTLSGQHGLNLSAAVAADWGEVFADRAGFMMGISWAMRP